MKKTLFSAPLLLMAIPCLAQPTEPARPVMQVKGLHDGESPVTVSDIDIDVKVVGSLAVSTVEMTFYNPNGRVLEGELQFPLSEGQSVSRFALDIDGKLREGVVVEKSKGQEVFEATIRRGVDPGLLEKTQGNNFRTRVYPLPGGGTRRVVIGYEEELPREGDSYRVFVPVEYGSLLANFNLRATVFGEDSKPETEKTPWGDFSFTKQGDAYLASYSAKQYRPTGQLVFSLPIRNAKQTFVEKGAISGQTVFYSTMFPEVKEQVKQTPKHISLWWDASASMDKRAFGLEEELLNGYFKRAGNVKVDLYTFNCLAGAPQTFSVKEGNWEKLRVVLEKMPYDGATQVDMLDFSTTRADEVLLFTDGLGNFGGSVPKMGKAPVTVVNSSLKADHSALNYIASVSRGRYVNLLRQAPAEAVKSMMNDNYRLISTSYDRSDVSELTLSATILRGGEGFSVAGKLNGATAAIRLNFGVGNTIQHTETLVVNSRDAAQYGNMVERAWAAKRIAELDMLYDRNTEEIESLGRKYNIVTRNTSLIVLDDVNDYVRHRIVPPAELLEEYNNRVREIETDKKESTRLQIDEAAELFEKRKEWWEKDFSRALKPAKAPVPARRPEPRPETPPATQPEAQPTTGPATPATIRSGSVSGVVTDSDRRELVGAWVWNESTNIGAVTDTNGRYSIDAQNGDMLTFAYLGYQSQTVQVVNNIANAVLEDDHVSLDQVVVTGYGQTIPSRAVSERFEADEILTDEIREVRAAEDVQELAYVVDGSAKTSGKNDGAARVHSSPVIELKGWQSDSPYLASLGSKSDEELYEAYLAIRQEYNTTPSFFLEAAILFEQRGLKEKALVVLSNLAELETENYKLLRVLG